MSAFRRTLAAAGAGLLLFGCATCKPAQGIAAEPVRAPEGMGQRAYQHAAQLCAIGPRPTGSMGWNQGLAYITKQLIDLGLKPQKDTWINRVENLEFTNIKVRIPGENPGLIVLGCHHDTKKCSGHADPAHNFEFVGANDSGSGVGLLIELARVLKDRKNRATYELVFFDGEESVDWDWNPDRALFGSRRYVRQYQQGRLDDPTQPKIECFILLDMVGAKDLHIDNDTNSDRFLKDVFLAAATAVGHEKYFYENSLPVSDDHLPFLDAKIPAIDLIDLEDNPHWHEPTDTIENLSPESLRIVGECVLTALPVLERHYFPAKTGQ